MAAAKLNLIIEKGATLNVLGTWTAQATGVPIDLTGCTALGHVREDLESAIPLLTLSTLNGRVLLGGKDGTVRIRVQDEDTAVIPWTAGVYDLLIAFPNGDVVKLWRGSVAVVPSVTRFQA